MDGQPRGVGPGDRADRADRTEGLTEAQAAERLAEHGRNELPPPERENWPRRWLRQLREPMSVLLMVAALVSGVWLGETVEAVAILAIVVLNAVIAVVQEGRAQQALDALRELETPIARVRRDGRLREVPTGEIVPDDLVVIEAGDRVPADLRVLEASSLEVDEAILTGESLPVAKAPGEDDRALSGTLVTRGTGSGVVAATGPDSTLGQIAATLRQRQPPTPLQRQLGALSRRLGLIAVALSAGVFGLTLLRTGLTAEGIQEALLTAIALAVAAVPEGLPAVTTIGLAIGVHRMAAHGAIVRRLPAVEALGSTDVVAVDKTGTLTQNRMELTALSVAGEEPEPLAQLPAPLRSAVAATTVLASTATLDPPTGDPLEIALLEAIGSDELADVTARHDVVDRLPFDAERRRSLAVADGPEGLILHLKGAPETVLERCSAVMTPDGATIPLDDALRARILELTDRLAGTGVRTIALAQRHLDATPEDPRTAEQELTLVAIAGLRDAVRPSAAETVSAMGRAGIRLLMVTGDHAGTARAVAREVGLAGDDDEVITGAALRRDGPPADPAAHRVYARVEPDQKLALVHALHEAGHAVAMTGDGVNDAPALRAADIGVALGRTGSDVAREAAAMVITDDDLATLHVAVREGRAIYDNIRKVVDYLVAGNLSEIAVVVTVLLAFPQVGIPLFPLQLLWINLLTDGLPALALGVDPPDQGLMQRPPRAPDQRLLSGHRIAVLAGRGAVIAAVTVATFWLARSVFHLPVPEARTVLFTTLVLAHLLYALVARQPDVLEGGAGRMTGLTANPWLLASIAAGGLLHALIVVWPPARAVFDTTGLDARSWLLVAVAAVLPTVAMLAARLRAGRADHAVSTTG